MTKEELRDYVEEQRNLDIIPYHVYSALIDSIDTLEQEPKTGHWITQWNPVHQKEYYYCSECREEFSYDGETGIKMNDYNYCPNCGAKMVEPQERSE